LGSGVRRTSQPRSNAYLRNKSRKSSAAASDSRTRGDRSNASAHRRRASSFSGVSMPASGGGCLVVTVEELHLRKQRLEKPFFSHDKFKG
jgi:hypothetical protein